MNTVTVPVALRLKAITIIARKVSPVTIVDPDGNQLAVLKSLGSHASFEVDKEGRWRSTRQPQAESKTQ